MSVATPVRPAKGPKAETPRSSTDSELLATGPIIRQAATTYTGTLCGRIGHTKRVRVC